MFGSAIHSVLQKTKLENYLKEERLSFTVNGIAISGAFDLYGNETITDYKVTSVWNVIYGSSNSKWEKQLNIYYYMLFKSSFIPKRAQVIAILRDWFASKLGTTYNYPPSPIHIYPVKLWTMDKLEMYLDERTKLFASSESLSDNDLPPCTNEEKWATETKYAVMKKGRKSAVRVLSNPDDAEKLITDNIKKGYYLNIRKGESKRCKKYCSVRNICNLNQYKKEM